MGEKSNSLWKRGEQLIPCGTQTASKGPDQFVKGVYPIYLQAGKGSHVFDVDGNEYIDYPCSLGAILLGHGYPSVVKAIAKQAQEGIIFSLLHPLEVELAEALTKIIPCAEQVRFMKNGSDATSGAIRIARAYTKKEKIATCGYHGWQDWFVISTEKNKGVPAVLKDYIYKFKYNDLESLKKIFAENKGEIAAVIMEPVITEEPRNNFLEEVQKLAQQNGALLIFDEMVTGFRFGAGGAQGYFGVTPDLACFGKSVANGMPLSILVGRKKVMEECKNIFLSMTFGGEAVSLAAAVATLQEMKEKNVVQHIWEMGKRFKGGYNQIAKEIGVETESLGYPPRQNLVFREMGGYSPIEIKSIFLQETIKRGILLGNVVFFNYAHTPKDIEETLGACKETLQIIKNGMANRNLRELLEGELAGEVFRKKAE